MDIDRFSSIIIRKGRKSLVYSLVCSVKGSSENKRSDYNWENVVNGTTVEKRLYDCD